MEKHWGVKSKLSSLDSEFDLNILVRSTDDNNDYVLKIMREDCLHGRAWLRLRCGPIPAFPKDESSLAWPGFAGLAWLSMA